MSGDRRVRFSGKRSYSSSGASNPSRVMGVAGAVLGVLSIATLQKTFAKDVGEVDSHPKPKSMLSYKDEKELPWFNEDDPFCLRIKDEKELDRLRDRLENYHHRYMRLECDDALRGRPVVKEIQLLIDETRDNFQERITPEEALKFSELSYSSECSMRSLPPGWEIFDECSNQSNGYYGIALVNHQTGNVCIAHRGTEFPKELSAEALLRFYPDAKADLFEICRAKFGPQQGSAIEFSRGIYEQVSKRGYRIGMAGHSLGGWLAQVCAYDLRKRGAFAKGIIRNLEPYAVCIDSPGAKEIIDEVYRTRYGSDRDIDLDVLNLVLVPNVVNTLGTHLGVLCQVHAVRSRSTLEKAVGSHSLKEFPTDELLRESRLIVDWPRVMWGDIEPGVSLQHLLNVATKLLNPAQLIPDVVDYGKKVHKKTEEFRLSLRDDLSSQDKEYRARYHVVDLPLNVVVAANVPTSVAKLFRHIEDLRKQYNEAVFKEFISDVARTEGQSVEDLESLSTVKEVSGVFRPGSEISMDRLRTMGMLLVLAKPQVRRSLSQTQYNLFVSQRAPHLVPRAPYPFTSSITHVQPMEGSIPRKAAVVEISNAFEEQDCVVLTGPLGSGKEEMAKQYGESVKGKCTVYILDASSRENLVKDWGDFKYMAPEWKGEDRRKGRKFLLILRNAKASRDIQECIFEESGFKGKILITSETTGWRRTNAVVLDVQRDFDSREVDAAVMNRGIHYSETVRKQLVGFPFVLQWLKRAGESEREKLVTALQGGQSVKQVVDQALQFVREDPTMVSVLSVLSFIPEMSIPKSTLEKTICDPAFLEVRGEQTSRKSFHTSVERLKNLGIIVVDEKTISIPKEFAVPHLRQVFDSRELKDTLLNSCVEFLSRNFSMSNISSADNAWNRSLVPFCKSVLSELDRCTLASREVQIRNALANHFLQNEDMPSAEEMFKEVEKLCKVALRERDVFDVVKVLKEKKENLTLLWPEEIDDLNLCHAYARALHYRGKIVFQKGRESHKKAEELFTKATQLVNEIHKVDALNSDVRVDTVIFQRQGEGWILLENMHEGDLSLAENLYHTLLSKDSFAFNQYYCNLQMAKALVKQAEIASGPNRDAIVDHFYRRALLRLRDGGEDLGVPFKSALMVINEVKGRGGMRDARIKTLREIAKILGRQGTSLYDFQSAEKALTQALEECDQGLENGSGSSKIKVEDRFETYFDLVKLYKNEQSQNYSSKAIRAQENIVLQNKAVASAQLALNALTGFTLQQLIHFKKKKQAEIEYLEEVAAESMRTNSSR